MRAGRICEEPQRQTKIHGKSNSTPTTSQVRIIKGLNIPVGLSSGCRDSGATAEGTARGSTGGGLLAEGAVRLALGGGGGGEAAVVQASGGRASGGRASGGRGGGGRCSSSDSSGKSAAIGHGG